MTSVTHVSIDETKFIPSVGNYQFVVTNALNGSVLALLPNRLAPLVTSFMHENFPNLEVITQDFWDTYRSVGLTHKARIQIIVDRFHFVRFTMWAYNRARVEIQKQKTTVTDEDMEASKQIKKRTK